MEGSVGDSASDIKVEQDSVNLNHSLTLHSKLHSSSPPCRAPVTRPRCLAPAATIAS
jgi:hypothetical protein